MFKLTNPISLFIYAIILVLLPHSFAIASSIRVDRAIVTFKPDEPPRQDITVINTGTENAYINIEILSVLNPGTEREQRIKQVPNRTPIQTDNTKVPGSDQAKNEINIDLLATPNKLIVPPNGRKVFRIVDLGSQKQKSRERERIYRINVTPVAAPLQNPKESVVQVVVGYQILVLIPPAQAIAKLVAKYHKDAVMIENRGNSNALLSECRQCSTPDACIDLNQSKRLYAGNQWRLPLSTQDPVTCNVTSVNGNRQETFARSL